MYESRKWLLCMWNQLNHFIFSDQKAPESEVHKPLKNCGSSVQNLIHVTILAPHSCKWLLHFLKICALVPISSAKVKNVYSCTPNPTYNCMAYTGTMLLLLLPIYSAKVKNGYSYTPIPTFMTCSGATLPLLLLFHIFIFWSWVLCKDVTDIDRSTSVKYKMEIILLLLNQILQPVALPRTDIPWP